VRGLGAGLVFAGLDPLHQFGEAGEEVREQGQDQRDHDAGRPVFGGLRRYPPQGGGDALGWARG